MDSIESHPPELKKIEGSASQPIRTILKHNSHLPRTRHMTMEQHGSGGFMSVPFDGSIGEDILFANEMPRAVPWSVAWADVMMTMFIIFAALYLYKAPAKETAAIPEVKTEHVEKEVMFPWVPVIHNLGRNRPFRRSII